MQEQEVQGKQKKRKIRQPMGKKEIMKMKVTDGNITKCSMEEAMRAWTGKDRQDKERNDRRRKETKGA